MSSGSCGYGISAYRPIFDYGSIAPACIHVDESQKSDLHRCRFDCRMLAGVHITTLPVKLESPAESSKDRQQTAQEALQRDALSVLISFNQRFTNSGFVRRCCVNVCLISGLIPQGLLQMLLFPSRRRLHAVERSLETKVKGNKQHRQVTYFQAVAAYSRRNYRPPVLLLMAATLSQQDAQQQQLRQQQTQRLRDAILLLLLLPLQPAVGRSPDTQPGSE